jgi:vacuolar fusion protein MON1
MAVEGISEEGNVHDTKPQEAEAEGGIPSNGETDTTEDYDNDPTPTDSREGTPPPLPPRPSLLETPKPRPHSPAASLRITTISSRPPSSSRAPLPSRATTALSLADVHVQSHAADDELRASPTSHQIGFSGLRYGNSRRGSEGDDTASLRSYAPTLEAAGDMESMLGDVPHEQGTPGYKPLTPKARGKGIDEDDLFPSDPVFHEAFEHEFDELDDITSDGLNEG